jgi:hypothetical protein
MILRSLSQYIIRRSSSSSGFNSNNVDVIGLWRRVLAGVHAPSDDPESQDQTLKDLVATGISLNKGRHQNLFPDELIAYFRSYYSTLELEEKRRLFTSLADVFSIDKTQIDAAVEHWNAVRSREENKSNLATTASPISSSAAFGVDEASLRAAERLYQSTQPLYSRLWTPLAQQNDGLAFLIDLRGDLRACIFSQAGSGSLRLLSEGLRRTLAGWFNVGLLRLERVTWEDTPASILEKIASQEKVHTISDFSVLKSRLGAQRRVFAWMHPSLPGEPLVALHVALCSSLVGSMDDILLKENIDSSGAIQKPTPSQEGKKNSAPTVAIFYSISNMKQGLAGVDLGNNLIKRVAKELVTEIPSLKILATLSPLPGFASWVESMLTRVDQRGGEKLTELSGMPLLLPEEKEQLILALENVEIDKAAQQEHENASHVVLRQAIIIFRKPTTDSPLQSALKPPLLRLAAHYLLKEKHRGRALDSVANFHLRNGAKMHRLNWMADSQSVAGMERSYGIMVNYMYDMTDVEENNRKYIIEGKIAVSEEIEDLLKI